MRGFSIERCTEADHPDWLAFRQALWPEDTAALHLKSMKEQFADPRRYAQFVAYASDRQAIGFAEVSIRSDYVNGTTTSPVAFLEGIYVVPEHRRRGVAAELIGEAVRWARESGCRELASDALLDNGASHAMHRALGFTETERVVYFRRDLG